MADELTRDEVELVAGGLVKGLIMGPHGGLYDIATQLATQLLVSMDREAECLRANATLTGIAVRRKIRLDAAEAELAALKAEACRCGEPVADHLCPRAMFQKAQEHDAAMDAALARVRELEGALGDVWNLACVSGARLADAVDIAEKALPDTPEPPAPPEAERPHADTEENPSDPDTGAH
jgi:hypothetical protein